MKKNLPACGNPDCQASSTINEDVSFGSGELDPLGFWEVPCAVCARAYEKKFKGQKAWPYEKSKNP